MFGFFGRFFRELFPFTAEMFWVQTFELCQTHFAVFEFSGSFSIFLMSLFSREPLFVH